MNKYKFALIFVILLVLGYFLFLNTPEKQSTTINSSSFVESHSTDSEVKILRESSKENNHNSYPTNDISQTHESITNNA
ncbi:MAG: hypothetical protein AB8B80_06130, partial [Marinicellaceae bacterium]